jgi:hypothetical protein
MEGGSEAFLTLQSSTPANDPAGDQDRIDRTYIPSVQGQRLLDLAGTNSGVDQQPDAICLDVDAVAVAARLEGDDFHGNIVSQNDAPLKSIGRWPDSGYNGDFRIDAIA